MKNKTIKNKTVVKKSQSVVFKYKLGWKPDVPDFRDFTYKAPRAVLKKLPTKVDLRKYCPSVYHQGDLGS